MKESSSPSIISSSSMRPFYYLLICSSSSMFNFCAKWTCSLCFSSNSISARDFNKFNSCSRTWLTALLKLSSFSLTVLIHFLLIYSKGWFRKFSFFFSSSETYYWAAGCTFTSDAFGAAFDSSCCWVFCPKGGADFTEKREEPAPALSFFATSVLFPKRFVGFESG